MRRQQPPIFASAPPSAFRRLALGRISSEGEFGSVIERNRAISIMPSMRILLIEDKKKTAGFLAKGLREDGLTVEIAHDGESGLDLAHTRKFDLLIVDVMLPNKDGWTVVTELRK